MSKLGWIVTIQGIVIALLLVVIVLGHVGKPAQAQMVAATDSLKLEPVHLINTASIAWLLDARNQRICVYEYEYNRGLRLVAARDVRWDLKLGSLNALSPKPSKVRDDYFKNQERKK